MIDDILRAAAVNSRQSRHQRPPAGTYAVWFDDKSMDMPDKVDGFIMPYICTHAVRIELYEEVPDPQAEAALEAQLLARGLAFDKEDRYWLQEVQRYQVIYTLTYTAKGG